MSKYQQVHEFHRLNKGRYIHEISYTKNLYKVGENCLVNVPREATKLKRM